MTDHNELSRPGDEPEPDVHEDTADLQRSLVQLSSLVTGSFGLEQLLAQVATFAAQAVPGADGAGVTLLQIEPAEHRVEALAASAEFVREIDEIQYAVLNEGPCITAARDRRTVRSGSLGGESLWPRFGPRVGRLGVHSVLSLPLLLPENTLNPPQPSQVVGAINVYARAKDAFDDRAAALGEAFAAPAAVAVHNANVLARAQALAQQLQTALATRPMIDQAIGILRARTGATPTECFDRLKSMSQADNVKLSLVAQRIVDEAVRRARARHTN